MLNAGQDIRISIYQTYFLFVPLFSKPILTIQIILSTKNSQEFFASWFPFWGEIKPLTRVLLTIHFSAALKALVLGNLFKVFRLDISHITFAREVCHLGTKTKKIWQSSYFFIIPNGKMPVRMWWQIFQTWINYLIQGFSLQLKMDGLKYWSWWLYFSSRQEPSVLKTGRRFP